MNFTNQFGFHFHLVELLKELKSEEEAKKVRRRRSKSH